MGKVFDIAECYSEHLKLNPWDYDTFIEKGRILYSLDKKVEAVGCFNEIIRIRPNALYNLKGKGEMLKCYDEVIKVNSDNPALFCYRAILLNILGKETDALQDFNRAYNLMQEISSCKNEYQVELISIMCKQQEDIIEFIENFQNLKNNFKKAPEMLKEILEKEAEVKEKYSIILGNLLDYLYKSEDQQIEIQKIGKEIIKYQEKVCDIVGKLW